MLAGSWGLNFTVPSSLPNAASAFCASSSSRESLSKPVIVAMRITFCYLIKVIIIYEERRNARATADVWNRLDVGLSSFRPYP